MKTRIMIVDDEKEFVQTLAERLTLRDYDVTVSFSGDDAIEKIKQFNFDVVILDVQMPGTGGVEVLKEIKSLKPLTEVIMLTGHATVDTAIEGLKHGATDYLMKPCDTDDLIAKINKAYETKAVREEKIRDEKVKDIISSPRTALKK